MNEPDCLKFMEAALTLAEEALKQGEVPIGCVLVYKGEVIATGRNTVNEVKNATRHAEINALDIFFEFCKTNNLCWSSVLPNCFLYVTVEPCIMCADTISNLGLGYLIFGCRNDRFGGCGSVFNVLEYFNKSQDIKVISGIGANRAIDLLKQFYQGSNPNVPLIKTKLKI